MYTREEYENLINNSPLFNIDKQNNLELYKAERYAFLTLLTDYYRYYIFPHKQFDEYSFALIETATECLKYYVREKGDFLHLFNKATKRNMGIAKAKDIIDAHRQGIKLPTYEEQMICKITALAKSKNLDINDISVQIKVATLLGISTEKVTELIHTNNDAVAVSDTVSNEDGDEFSIIDLQVKHGNTFEDEFVFNEELKELILKIHNVFDSVQERQKPLLSLLLTAEIIKSLDYDIKSIVSLLNGVAFFNLEIIHWYEKYNSVPTAKQIGELCGVSEQSLSRTYKN
ncbi:MAG: hypothetical protein NC131_15275, partial [Roseburia sp.]|nr:hypothetical protein [Roseburia sp.]